MAWRAIEAQNRFIPTSFEELTPDFVNGVLEKAGILKGARISRCEIEIIGDGLGFAGQVARIHLGYADGSEPGPASLIAKLPSRNWKNRATIEAIRGYEREVCFFRELADGSQLPLPRCYYAEMDLDPRLAKREADQRFLERLPVFLLRLLIPLGIWIARISKRRYLILLEDLAPARNGDQVQGCDAGEAERCIRGLAAFHASYWADPGLSEKYWIPKVDDVHRTFIAVHRNSRRRFYKNHADRLPEGLRDACDWMDRNYEAVIRHLATPPRTLVHGDYRLDNLFFAGDEMWAADLQTVIESRPAPDLATFITGSVKVEVEEKQLLAVYCDELEARGVKDYGLSLCQRDYALTKLLLLYNLVAADDVLDFGDERGPQLLERMRERLYARIPEQPFDNLLERPTLVDPHNKATTL
ncbi:MAG: hypothetical protein GY725_07730 [bacterium]|nr:hypothetical protein [bacterium]